MPADVYALGMTILEIITGRQPFVEYDLSPLVSLAVLGGKHPQRPDEVSKNTKFGDERWSMMLTCWDMQPDSRPTAGGVKEMFNKKPKSLPVLDVPSSPTAPTSKCTDYPYKSLGEGLAKDMQGVGGPSKRPYDSYERDEAEPKRLKTQVEQVTEKMPQYLKQADSYEKQGKWDRATKLRLRIFQTHRRWLGDEHYETFNSMQALANAYMLQCQFDLAAPLQLQVLDARRRLYGDGHPDTIESKHILACTYAKQYRLEEAKELELEVLSARKRIYGQEHPKTRQATQVLAVIQYKQGQKKQPRTFRQQTQGYNLDQVRLEAMRGSSQPTEIRINPSPLDMRIGSLVLSALAQIARSPKSETPVNIEVQESSGRIAGGLRDDAGVNPSRILDNFESTSHYIGSNTRAIREAYLSSIAAKTEHPNIMAFMGVALFKGQLALVTPWMPNGTLMAYILKHPTIDRWKLCQQVAEGLACIHGLGMVHGDLKAANVFVSEEGVAKIGDLGNAILSDASLDFTATSNVGGGTSRWMARELLLRSSNDNSEVDRSMPADVFALAMAILEVMTGRRPYSEHESDPYVTLLVIRGIPPQRPPEFSSETRLGNGRWAMLNDCWRMEPGVRPTASEIRSRMRTLT
ncbi:hypothetical protein FRC06_010586 [Ceratobasidium sp. 370]|nr:hypothetical protein FRC06_010586 [Ceratobasidium sp. 370]